MEPEPRLSLISPKRNSLIFRDGSILKNESKVDLLLHPGHWPNSFPHGAKIRILKKSRISPVQITPVVRKALKLISKITRYDPPTGDCAKLSCCRCSADHFATAAK